MSETLTDQESVPPRVLQLALMGLAGIFLAAVPTLARIAGPVELAAFLTAGTALGMLSLLLGLRRVRVQVAGPLAVALVAMVIMVRIGALLLGGYFNDPSHSFLMPIFGYTPILYLMIFVLLPVRIAVPSSVVAWAGFGLFITVLTLPYWRESPTRPSLPGLLGLVWLGNGLFVLLLASLMLRRQQAVNQDRRERELARAALAYSEHQFRGIFDQAAVGIAMLEADGRWLTVNQRLCQIVGYSREELLRLDFQTITHPEDLERDVAQAKAVVDGELTQYQMEKRYLRKDGSIVWVLLHVSRIDPTPSTPMYFVAVIVDLSDRKAAEARAASLSAELEAKVAARTAQLRESMESWKQRGVELNAIAELGGFLSAARDADETSRLITSYLPRLFPYATGSVYLEDGDQELLERCAQWGTPVESHPTFHRADCWSLRRGQDYRVQIADGMPRCPHLGDYPPDRSHLCVPLIAAGEAIGVLQLGWGADAVEWEPDPVMLRSVAKTVALAVANLRLREELHRQAIRDILTGLYNRRFFEESLAKRHARMVRDGSGYSVLLIDIDHFKAVNDQYGHDAGDAVLQQIGKLLVELIRSDELPFRYGGEEFAVLTEAADAETARAAAERIRQHLARSRIVHRGAVLPTLTVSIGVAVAPPEGLDPHQVVALSDQALYQAKLQGRDRVCLAGEGGAGIPAPRPRHLRPVPSPAPERSAN